MQNVKGTYDFIGREQAVRLDVQTTLRELFELYGFEPVDTTVLNGLELLTSKYAGGDEILREMYRLTDQGGRELGLRYDLTIPFTKVIALNPGLEFPFKRYEMGKVFRDGPVKKGRLREFMQCDADVVGIAGPQAEAELLMLASDVFRKLKIPVVIKWNNRRFLGELLEKVGVPEEELLSVMLTLDKLAKAGSAGVIAELEAKGLTQEALTAIGDLLSGQQPTFDELASAYGLEGQPGALEVQSLERLLRAAGLGEQCIFDAFLSRGLSFYTGTVYEIFDASGAYTSSLGGGGRYDTIIGKLLQRDEPAYPAVGISFGIESIMAMLGERVLRERPAPVLILPLGDYMAEALGAAASLRSAGIRCEVDGGGRKLKKVLASASARGVRFCLIIGEEEASLGLVRLKDMLEQTEELMTADKAVWRIE
ncbi:histidine--tRNA ligase [Paenibacillus sp. NFR01]|uniref:histidine--tRNA ligase n=1 Tax=Paenibacillus sp. NFR01 TaxID=1566279 RepID=UPI0008CF657B|nr:histidine--tRNA ligase [Paenibacillus sp. NFR01]SES97304.1 histidyl-tRNA synthetase [Paenibacillus sp. NFR01]